MKQGVKWDEKEDEILISAWVNVGLDPVIGTGQKASTFWLQVYEYFVKDKEQYPNHKWPTPRSDLMCNRMMG